MPVAFVKRTVSPLRFESLQPDPDDILCLGSEAEETLEGHEAKRRRVEQAGEEYLRGKPLYIASARLKGPFTFGWNDLAPTRKTREQISEGRSRATRHRIVPANVKREIVPGCKDVPVEISSHETEATIPTPPARSRRGTSTEHIIKQAGPKYPQRPRTRKGEGTTRHSVPATSKSLDVTQQPENARISLPHGRNWLKSATRNKELLKKSLKSPTPSPAPRSQGQAEVASPRSRTKSRSVAGSRESSTLQEALSTGRSDLCASPSFERLRGTPDVGRSIEPHGTAEEAKLSSSSPDTQRARKTVNKLSQVAAERAQDDWALSEANQLSEAAITRARSSAIVVNEPVALSDKPDTAPEALHMRRSKPSAQVIPSSTNLAEFEYRYGSVENSRSLERKSFKEDLEAAKKKARAEKRWRLSFTASGSVKGRNATASSNGHRLPQLSQRTSGPTISQSAGHSSEERTKRVDKPIPKADEETTVRPMEMLPEAQLVQEPALKIPSGPSTGMLETDKLSLKLPSIEEGDSYLGLSTQAAMLKAQNTFQNDLVSPVSNRMGPPLPRIRDNRADNAVDDEEWQIVDHPTSKTEFLTPRKDNEAINTQAMIDAISPFADTTIKKRPALDRRSSSIATGSEASASLSPPAPNFETTSLSMSTSPSPTPAPANHHPPIPLSALSKTASSVTSFSIAPNGTMTEVYQQDGQRAQEYLMSDLELDAAIEEAGSFLGEWNLEKEARNQERSSNKASTAQASRSH
ncbi:hypothetical protein XANCAGTX0491_005059 [Xanthoria calcicola]